MENTRIVQLGELSAVGTTEWVRLSNKAGSGLAKIQVAQVTAKGTVTAADVDIEHSIDGVGALPLLNAVLSTALQSDGAAGVSQLSVFARARLKSITGGGAVMVGLIVEE